MAVVFDRMNATIRTRLLYDSRIVNGECCMDTDDKHDMLDSLLAALPPPQLAALNDIQKDPVNAVLAANFLDAPDTLCAAMCAYGRMYPAPRIRITLVDPWEPTEPDLGDPHPLQEVMAPEFIEVLELARTNPWFFEPLPATPSLAQLIFAVQCPVRQLYPNDAPAIVDNADCHKHPPEVAGVAVALAALKHHDEFAANIVARATRFNASKHAVRVLRAALGGITYDALKGNQYCFRPYTAIAAWKRLSPEQKDTLHGNPLSETAAAILGGPDALEFLRSHLAPETALPIERATELANNTRRKNTSIL